MADVTGSGVLTWRLLFTAVAGKATSGHSMRSLARSWRASVEIASGPMTYEVNGRGSTSSAGNSLFTFALRQ